MTVTRLLFWLHYSVSCRLYIKKTICGGAPRMWVKIASWQQPLLLSCLQITKSPHRNFPNHEYKGNLIAKIGGTNQFDFGTIDYCENIQ